MPLPLDEVFRRMALAKGDLPCSPADQAEAKRWYYQYVDQLTRQLQREAPGDLTVTHESVHETVDLAYREYRRRKEQAAARRRLRDNR